MLTFLLQFNVPLKPWKSSALRDIAVGVLRVCFWALFIEVILHFFYFNAIIHHRRLMKNIPLWVLAGIGYGSGQFFMVKVSIIQSISTAW